MDVFQVGDMQVETCSSTIVSFGVSIFEGKVRPY